MTSKKNKMAPKPTSPRRKVKSKPAQKTGGKSILDIEKGYRLFVENSPDLLLNLDRNGTILFINQPFPGYKLKDVTGTHLLDYLPAEQRPGFRERLKKMFETGKPQFVEHDTVGPGRWCTRLVPIKQKETTLSAMVISTDISDHRKIEEEFLKEQKLKSLGLLAGGIAHDFNNILTAILGNISLAKLLPGSSDSTFKLLGEAEKASLRAKDLSNQLLIFARGGVPVKKMTFIEDILKRSAEFALRGSTVRAELFTPQDLWPAEIDEGQIGQVIHNIIINAQQAMVKGGIVELRAENVIITPKQGKELLLKNGEYLKITAKDSGPGIPDEFIHQVFDPYFTTTKQRGGDLGLSAAYSIIRGHGGHISVASEPGRGTTFSIFLPAFPKATLPSREIEPFLETSFNIGKSHVLIMDDEESVREVGGKILGHLGFEAEYARDGAEAVKIFLNAKEKGQPFDLVILDLTVPGGMGGEETIKKLIEIDPSVKAVVSSGYSDNPVMSEFQKYGFSGVVTKPYRIRDFSRALAMAVNQNWE